MLRGLRGIKISRPGKSTSGNINKNQIIARGRKAEHVHSTTRTDRRRGIAKYNLSAAVGLTSRRTGFEHKKEQLRSRSLGNFGPQLKGEDILNVKERETIAPARAYIKGM